MPEEHSFNFYLLLIFLSLAVLLIFSNFISTKIDRNVVLIRVVILAATAIVGVFLLFAYVASLIEKSKKEEYDVTIK